MFGTYLSVKIHTSYDKHIGSTRFQIFSVYSVTIGSKMAQTGAIWLG